MVNDTDWHNIAGHIADAVKQPYSISDVESISGGCINNAYLVHGNTADYFVKLNQAHLADMFEAEFNGLQEIAESRSIKAPTPVCTGIQGDKSFLVLEYLQLKAKNSTADAQLGQQLAALHKIQKPFFGWHIDNTIGSTRQINCTENQWSIFWRDSRLLFQLKLAEQQGYAGRLIRSGEKLADSLEHFFSDHKPHPSLLHGDLWSGNAAMTADGQAVIYDPACYYGDRETDIAMTELFGGFSNHFYRAYNESYPLDNAYQLRKTLYNLYHILNHLNLFGSGYQSQAQQMIDSLLAEIA